MEIQGKKQSRLEGKDVIHKDIKKNPTDGGMPPKGLQTMEESILDRYSPQGDVSGGGSILKQLQRAKKKEESKRQVTMH